MSKEQIFSGMGSLPASAEACLQAGLKFARSGRLEQALSLLRRAVHLEADNPVAQANLGIVLGMAGNDLEAISCLSVAVQRWPDNFATHLNLGVALQRSNRMVLAEAAFRKAIELDPQSAEAHLYLAHNLRLRSRLDDAAHAYRSVLGIRPESAEALRYLAVVEGDRGDLKARLRCIRRLLELSGATAADHSSLLVNLNYDADQLPEQLLDEAKSFGHRLREVSESFSVPPRRLHEPSHCLHVGYVSPDFCEHPIGRLIEPILEGHNRSMVKCYCYSDVRRPNAVTDHLSKLADVWRDVRSLDSAALKSLVISDEIDILIDLAGHFGGNRLPAFASRMAPVQISHLGYCGTTGVEAIDYRLTDPISDPPGSTDRFHTEQLFRLPRTTWVYRPWGPTPDIVPPPFLQNGYITFGNLNNPIKTSLQMARTWSEILHQLPASRLRLLTSRGAEKQTANRFLQLGISAERLELVLPMERDAYLRQYNQIDICLDPFPFNGDNSTCDALWMGVPVISLVGSTFAARRGLAHLSAVDLPNLATPTLEQYVHTAVELGRDQDLMTDLRTDLRSRLSASSLGDVPGFISSLESAYRFMWQKHIAS